MLPHFDMQKQFWRFGFSSILIFLFCLISGNAFTSSSTKGEETIFSLPLDDIFHRFNEDQSSDLTALDHFLRRCESEQEELNSNLLISSSLPSPCNKARYLSGVLEMERQMVQEDRDHMRASSKQFNKDENGEDISNQSGKESITSISKRTNRDMPYGEYFVNFQLQSSPVVIENLPPLIQNKPAFEVLMSCIENIPVAKNNNGGMGGTQDRTFGKKSKNLEKSTLFSENVDQNYMLALTDASSFCPEFNLHLHLQVPKYVLNDYLQRADLANSTSISPQHKYTRESLQITSLGLSSELVLSPSNASCPASLHGFYILLGEPRLTSSSEVIEEENSSRAKHQFLDARIFSPKAAATLLGPSILFDQHSDPHYSKHYAVDTWDTNLTTKTNERFQQAELGLNDALFVPSDSIVSFRWKQEKGGGGVLLRFCTLDASNFNKFKKVLKAEAEIDRSSKELLGQLENPKFDTTMQRELPDVSKYSHYKSWSRVTAESTQETAEVSSGATSKRQLKRGRRHKRGSFASWQSSKSWDHKILGLTLPTLTAPETQHCGRRNVTLSWLCPFFKKDGDISKISYIVSWVEFHKGNSSMRLSQGNASFEETHVLNSNFKVEYVTDAKSQITIKNLTGTVVGLRPDHAYSFQVAMVYGSKYENSQSPLSTASKLIMTEPPSKPFPLSSSPLILEPYDWNVTLVAQSVLAYGSEATTVVFEMRAPYDDGGLQLIGYDVMKSHIDSSGHNMGNWVLLTHGIEKITDENKPGGTVRIAIYDLLPGGKYVFKVAARNSRGRSPWSASSEGRTKFSPARRMRTDARSLTSDNVVNLKAEHALHGFGSREISTPNEHICRGPVLTIDDMEQKIMRATKAINIDVWSSYWSPRGFKVKAEACGAIFGEDGEILNTNDLEYRLAVIDRGGRLPLVYKVLAAQRSGALGVIIIDDGRCIDFDQYCVFGSSKENGDYWGELDAIGAWVDVLIPVVLAQPRGELENIRDSIFWSATDVQEALISS